MATIGLIHDLPFIKKNGQTVIYNPFSKEMSRIDNVKMIEIKEWKDKTYNQYEKERKAQQSDAIGMVITKFCNMRCRYCSIDSSSTSNVYMSDKVFHSAVNFAFENSKNKKIIFNFFGGEATTIGILKFKTIIEYIKKTNNKHLKNIKFSITSNGLFNTSFLNVFNENGFYVKVSFDGVPDVQGHHRPLPNGKNSYNQVLNNIKKLVNNKIDPLVRLTVSSFSLPCLLESYELLIQLGVKKLQIEPLYCCGRAITSDKKLLPPPADEYVAVLLDLIKRSEKHGVALNTHAYINFLNPSNSFCFTDSSECIAYSITIDGCITKCMAIQEISIKDKLSHAMVLGYYDQKQFKFILDAEKEKLFMSMLAARNDKNCKKCFAKYSCSGGCYYKNMSDDGAYSVPDTYYCNISKQLNKFILEDIYERTFKTEL
jgi:uncharacterized protein